MKKLIGKIEEVFTAITFAEAGEFDYARELMKSKEQAEESATVYEHV